MKRHSICLSSLLLCATLGIAGCELMRGMEVGGVSLSPLADAGEKLAKSSSGTSEQEETAMGRHMAGTLLGASRLDHGNRTQQYVNRVGRWLTLHSNRPYQTWRFGVLADDDINAFAAPGGYVFVTRGLLAILDNEAELAGVLAHEISHVTQRHYVNAMRSNNLMGAAMDVGMFLGDAATKGQASAQQREFGQRVVNASKQLYARGLDKGDEYNADAGALRLMALAGYDPYAFVAVMQKLEARTGNDSAMALLLQTHPRPADRLARMDDTLQSLPAGGTLATLEQRFRREVR